MFPISPKKRSEKIDVLFLKQCMNEIKSTSEIEDFKSIKRFETLEKLKQIKNKVENFRQKNQELESEISFETIELKKLIKKFF